MVPASAPEANAETKFEEDTQGRAEEVKAWWRDASILAEEFGGLLPFGCLVL